MDNRRFWALICFVFICIFAAVGTREKLSCTDEKHILELNATNFDTRVYNQPRASFVEFYASWCGHCIHYKPSFIKFANSLQSWSNTLQIAIVDCATEENSHLCRQHSIEAFPTLKYFKVGAENNDNAEIFRGNFYNLANMTKYVAGLVHKDYKEFHPIGWPKLEPSPSSLTLPDLWSVASQSASIIALVVDKDPYGDGFATMINYHTNPHVHTFVVDENHPLAVQFGDVPAPAVHIFKRDDPYLPSYSSNEATDFERIQTEVDKFIEHLQESVENQVAKLLDYDLALTPTSTASWEQFEVQYLDLTSALSYMLTQEIPRRNVIEGVHLKALQDWMHVLRQYLPLAAPVRRLFYKLDEYLKPLHSLTANDWLEHVKEYQNELDYPLPQSATYLACKGSKPFFRGYNCGLWTTFHVVTVEAYKQNKHNPNFRPCDEVLEPLHQFIFNYLSCVICAEHFDKMACETLPEVNTSEDTVLWLWKAHNMANKRLSGHASDDPNFPKQQFPPSSLCPKCRLPSGEFDDVEVVNFLTQYYSNIKTDLIINYTII